MRTRLLRWGGTAGLLTVLLTAAAAEAQDKKIKNAANQPDGPHQMVIYNGKQRITAHFPGKDASDSEKSYYRERATAENEQVLVDLLQQLRLQYVKDELSLLPTRRSMQEMLYGYASTFPGHWSPGGIANAPLYGGTLGSGYAGAGFPYLGGGLGYAYSGVPYPGLTGINGMSNAVTGADACGSGPFSAGGANNLSLANGVGDEGVLKREMAAVLAKQATPEYAAKVRERVGRLDEPDAKKGGVVLAASEGDSPRYEQGDRLKVTVKTADKATKEITGEFVRGNAKWMELRTGENETIQIPTADIVGPRYLTRKKD